MHKVKINEKVVDGAVQFAKVHTSTEHMHKAVDGAGADTRKSTPKPT